MLTLVVIVCAVEGVVVGISIEADLASSEGASLLSVSCNIDNSYVLSDKWGFPQSVIYFTQSRITFLIWFPSEPCCRVFKLLSALENLYSNVLLNIWQFQCKYLPEYPNSQAQFVWWFWMKQWAFFPETWIRYLFYCFNDISWEITDTQERVAYRKSCYRTRSSSRSCCPKCRQGNRIWRDQRSIINMHIPPPPDQHQEVLQEKKVISRHCPLCLSAYHHKGGAWVSKWLLNRALMVLSSSYNTTLLGGSSLLMISVQKSTSQSCQHARNLSHHR